MNVQSEKSTSTSRFALAAASASVQALRAAEIVLAAQCDEGDSGQLKFHLCSWYCRELCDVRCHVVPRSDRGPGA